MFYALHTCMHFHYLYVGENSVSVHHFNTGYKHTVSGHTVDSRWSVTDPGHYTCLHRLMPSDARLVVPSKDPALSHPLRVFVWRTVSRDVWISEFWACILSAFAILHLWSCPRCQEFFHLSKKLADMVRCAHTVHVGASLTQRRSLLDRRSVSIIEATHTPVIK